MERKFREISMSLLFLLISAVFAWEGKSFMLLQDDMHVHLQSHNDADSELPHQQSHVMSVDDEKIVSISSFDLSCTADIIIPIRCSNELKPLDYSGSVWQPPKSL